MIIELELIGDNSHDVEKAVNMVLRICESLELKVFDLRIRPYNKRI